MTQNQRMLREHVHNTRASLLEHLSQINTLAVLLASTRDSKPVEYLTLLGLRDGAQSALRYADLAVGALPNSVAGRKR